MFWREQIGGVHGHNSHRSHTDETQFYKCYIFLTTEIRWGLLQADDIIIGDYRIYLLLRSICSV